MASQGATCALMTAACGIFDVVAQVDKSMEWLSPDFLRWLLLMRRLSDRLTVLTAWVSKQAWATFETKDQVHR